MTEQKLKEKEKELQARKQVLNGVVTNFTAEERQKLMEDLKNPAKANGVKEHILPHKMNEQVSSVAAETSSYPSRDLMLHFRSREKLCMGCSSKH